MLRLRGNLVGLRRLKKSDVEVFHPLVTDPRVARNLPRLPRPYPIEEAYRWVQSTHRMARRRETFTFGIEGREEGAIVGVISLMDVRWRDGVAEVGCWVGRPYWRRGYGLEAVRLMVRFAFEELKLYRVFANVIESNTASAALLLKAGFVQEGVLRQDRVLSGRRQDLLWLGLLRSEWQRPKS